MNTDIGNKDHLRHRWNSMWKVLDNNGDGYPREYDQLVALYGEPHRKYHTLSHIAHCFREFEAVKHHFRNQLQVMFAIWYHDAIYNVQSLQNEEDSADLANTVMEKARLADTFKGAVLRMILASKHDKEPHIGWGGLLFLDIDLSILGAEPAIFDVYEKQIPEEYSWVDKDQYEAGRKDFIHGLLAKEYIFHTSIFREKYESQARSNLRRALALLE